MDGSTLESAPAEHRVSERTLRGLAWALGVLGAALMAPLLRRQR